MNQGSLKTYAQKARRDFIEAVSDRAALYGLTASGREPIVRQGDIVLIGERPFPREVAAKRGRLESRIRVEGFGQTMEAMAYTWFNRFAAIRYMELHGYLDHGYRVLSHPEGREQPEILDHAAEVDLPNLDREKVVELKLDGARDEELYRLLLTAQCNGLHLAMPFLFERIGDETELLLPVNLLHTDSLIRRLVNGIDESAWDDIEIIGWLYQFYISEKKDQIIGKVVKSEDIPAATQLFTPNWIVKYMVQNSLGAQWLATYPHSNLLGQMDYYIKPAEQTEEVRAQLAAITPSTLDPETLTLIDPACGSGHILVEAYDLFKAIYLERGYRQRDVPKLILEKNLFGLDIDARAAQLAGFAVMMRARADDKRLFERGVKLNVMAFVNSVGLDAERLAQGMKLADYGVRLDHLTDLKRLFQHATTFGALIQVPKSLAAELSELKRLSEATPQDLILSDVLNCVAPLVRQADLLVAQYDAVVANPPYMASKYQFPLLKKFLKDHYKGYEKDIFSAFIDRNLAFSQPHGRLGFMSPFVWMFISSHERLRTRLIEKETIASLTQLEYSGFDGATVPICAFTLQKGHVAAQKGCYIRLSNFRGSDSQGPKTLEAIRNRDCGWFFEANQYEFNKIPGCPVAYWVSERVLECYQALPALQEFSKGSTGLQTSNSARFLRFWYEIESGRDRWVSFAKGGTYRKWFGNVEHVVNWSNDGADIKSYVATKYPYLNGNYALVVKNESTYFLEGLVCSRVTSGQIAFRYKSCHEIYSDACTAIFPAQTELFLALLNSKLLNILTELNPTLNFQAGDIEKFPVKLRSELMEQVRALASQAIQRTRADWDSFERSSAFLLSPLMGAPPEHSPTLESSYTAWITQNRKTIAEMKRLEEKNNHLFISSYGLIAELTSNVPIEQITLTINPAYRYGGNFAEEEQWSRFRRDSMAELVSYAIGCMMGRYSLDAPGLIYAHSGNVGFDATRYTTFPADSDGLVPLTDSEWFDDDAANRLVKFVSVAWDAVHLEHNLAFLADNLAPRRSESSRDTIRRYLCDKFFKDHLQTYKNRPIYWLFSSGKYKAFQCLVYLHRYNEGTLARMRTEYVVPLRGMMTARVRQLGGDIAAATSTARRRRLEKERETLVKQQTELGEFDEKLRHYADRRIGLDLDNGVKVNYGKFGDLLASVTKVAGKKAG